MEPDGRQRQTVQAGTERFKKKQHPPLNSSTSTCIVVYACHRHIILANDGRYPSYYAAEA